MRGTFGRGQAVSDVGINNSRGVTAPGKCKRGGRRDQQVPRKRFSNSRTILQLGEFSLVSKGLLGPRVLEGDNENSRISN